MLLGMKTQWQEFNISRIPFTKQHNALLVWPYKTFRLPVVTRRIVTICPRWGHLFTTQYRLPPTENCGREPEVPEQLAHWLMYKHVDWKQHDSKFITKSQSVFRIAPWVGARRTISSAYARAPRKTSPMKQPNPDSLSCSSGLSIEIH